MSFGDESNINIPPLLNDPKHVIGIFFVLGVCFCVLLLLPRLCFRCVALFAGPASRAEPAVGWDRYECLSPAKRQAIDEMRSAVVARCVGRCSLTLAAGQLVRRDPGEEEGAGAEEPPPQTRETAGPDESARVDHQEDAIASTADSLVEEGAADALPQDGAEAAATEVAAAAAIIVSPAESPVEGEAEMDTLPVEEEEKGEESDYTHVRIPLPGYDCRGMRLQEEKVPAAETGGPRHRGRGRLLSCLFPPRQVPEEGRGKTREGAATDAAEDGGRPRGARRNVPALCAICLEAYAPGAAVVWSSNPECPHVYHRDCLVGWLRTLGRKTAQNRRFPDEPSVGTVLDYGLACPCCRQDFIAKDLALEEEEEEEEAKTEEERVVQCDRDGNV